MVKSDAGRRLVRHAVLGATLSALSLPTLAETWSDTTLGLRYGKRFAEPYEGNDINKYIAFFTHAGGYSFGQNFFNVDLLQSDHKDPGSGTSGGAQEAYIVYRNFISGSTVLGTPLKFDPIKLKDVGPVLGFDWNTKNDSYSSRKRQAVGGASFKFDVPGFFDIDLIALRESNDPNGVPRRYYYKTHPAATAAWYLGIGDTLFSWEGFALAIAAKGTNEFGGGTKPEYNIDQEIMFDAGAALGTKPKTFKIGIEYQYWKNKFGNPESDVIGVRGAGPGATAKTPMIRTEYHF